MIALDDQAHQQIAYCFNATFHPSLSSSGIVQSNHHIAIRIIGALLLGNCLITCNLPNAPLELWFKANTCIKTGGDTDDWHIIFLLPKMC